MRLGEIKQKIDRVISESKVIAIENEPLYGEQAQKVKNYPEIMDVLELLSAFEWNDVQSSEIREQLSDKYPIDKVAEMPLDDFNKLSSYVGLVNEKLPLYYSILETMVEKQDDQIINVRLPENIKTLENLADFNKRVSTLFKSFQMDGQFEFCEFDKGTCWYEIAVIGVYTYPYFIACLKIAQEYFKVESEYFKSREAKISYEAAKVSLNKEEEELTFDNYKNNWLEAFLVGEIRQLIKEKIRETNGETEESLQSKLVIATTNLVKELGEGTEFHLSLNPPEYAKEQAGQLVIDYKKIRETKSLKEVKKNQIGESSKKEIKEDENKESL
jgi:hypothetical protein